MRAEPDCQDPQSPIPELFQDAQAEALSLSGLIMVDPEFSCLEKHSETTQFL